MDKGYSKYIITFIDALATKERSKDFDESYKITRALNEAGNIVKDMPLTESLQKYYQQKIVRFSDTQVIFTKLVDEFPQNQKKPFLNKEHYHAWLLALNLWNISLIQSLLFMQNILVRGGITIGEAFCDMTSDDYFGPAFIEAYELENFHAIYPRVIIGPQIVANKSLFSSLLIESEKLNEQIMSFEDPFAMKLEEDFDGMYFINYLYALKYRKIKRNEQSSSPQSLYAIAIDKIIQRYKNEHSKLKKSPTNTSILQKYSWLVKKLEENGL